MLVAVAVALAAGAVAVLGGAAALAAADGPPGAVLTPELMRDVFGVHARLVTDAGADAAHHTLLAIDRPAAPGR